MIKGMIFGYLLCAGISYYREWKMCKRWNVVFDRTGFIKTALLWPRSL